MTLGLAFITNDVPGAKRLVSDYGEYFDKIYITVADKDKTVFHELKRDLAEHSKVKISYFKWCYSFGKARRFNQKQIKTDYFFWMDCDDTVDKPELLKPAVQRMAQEGIDAVFFNYSYYQNNAGEGQANHWRERIIRTKSGGLWADAPCHETIDVSGLRCERVANISVIHHKSVPDMEKTVDRNYELLHRDWKVNKDPRTAFYLGMTMMTKAKFKEAVEFFMFLIEHGGWEEQKIVAWCCIADCYFFIREYDKALVATNMAIHLDPSHPDPWYQKVIIYCSAQQYDKAVEFAHVAMTKKPKEDSMQLIDPTKYSYKGMFLAAQAYLFSGRIEEGFKLFQQVKATAPHFIKEVNAESKMDWNKFFEEALYDQKAIEYVKYLSKYEAETGGNNKKLFESLPKKIHADARLNAERVEVYPAVDWPEKSIAYYCGPSVVPWGPDMMADGLGGSEEAVIYLSRELAKLGWKVTVFCDRETEYNDGDVLYKPWTELNPWDNFNVFIASRQPSNLNGVKAKLKILDMHDVNEAKDVYSAEKNVDKIFVKSKWHREQYPKIPDEKFVIVGNAIQEGHFK